jgi:hypothetical protein
VHFLIDSSCGNVFVSTPDPPLALSRNPGNHSVNPLTVQITNAGPGAEGSPATPPPPGVTAPAGPGDPANSILTYNIGDPSYRLAPATIARDGTTALDSCFQRPVRSGEAVAQNAWYLPVGASCRFEIQVNIANPPATTLQIGIGAPAGVGTTPNHVIYTAPVSVP